MTSFSGYVHLQMHASEGAGSHVSVAKLGVTTRRHLQPKPPLMAVFAFAWPSYRFASIAASLSDAFWAFSFLTPLHTPPDPV